MDGELGKVSEFAKGDMYLFDLRKTRGHVGAVTGVCWDPQLDTRCYTGSIDTTVRLWEVESSERGCLGVFKVASTRTAANAVSSLCPGQGGVVAGVQSGDIHFFDPRDTSGRPSSSQAGAHARDHAVTSLACAPDGCSILSRSTDGTMKLWDLRMWESPLRSFGDLPCASAHTECCFGPSGNTLLTGTSAGELRAFSRLSFAAHPAVKVSASAVTRVQWHHGINQILAACADGSVRAYYSPEASNKGALLCANRAARVDLDDDHYLSKVGEIILPTVQEEKPRRREREVAHRIPERPKNAAPVIGRGLGGELGISEKAALMKGVIEGEGQGSSWSIDDARQAFLRHAEAAERDPKYVANAYKDSGHVLDTTSDQEEQDQKRQRR